MTSKTVAGVLLGLMVGVGAGCGGGGGRSFSATQFGIDAKGNAEQHGKIYVSGERYRIEIKAPEGPGQLVMIFSKPAQKHWMLNPAKKLYCEQAYNEAELEKFLHSSVAKEGEKILGTETVNGFKCVKKEVETTMSFMGFSRKSKATVWMSDALGMPVRTRRADGAGTELREIKKGRQPASLFEIPKDFKQVANMIALFASLDEGDGKGKRSRRGGRPPAGLPKGFKLPFGK